MTTKNFERTADEMSSAIESYVLTQAYLSLSSTVSMSSLKVVDRVCDFKQNDVQ